MVSESAIGFNAERNIIKLNDNNNPRFIKTFAVDSQPAESDFEPFTFSHERADFFISKFATSLRYWLVFTGGL